ncbi:vacuolar protein sorting-associated protein vps13 [Auricularia subglabra TFB-10046 SS5]|nr:vacuolar protein sorting-associated protein vps13 [Auricularia subglabra TFB-10046 SS5]
MWFSTPIKNTLNTVINSVAAPYIENFDLKGLEYGLGQGVATMSQLRLKKGVFDKFRLPVDVQEGFLGTLTLKVPWANITTKPVEIYIDNVYLLVVPAAGSKFDPKEDEQRAQEAKQERLRSAEAIQQATKAPAEQEDAQSQGFLSSLITKLLNNIQITVKNIHVRYEDKLSCPGHPFAAGVTLAGFTVISTNEDWVPQFIQSTKDAVHKLATLDSMAVYFDTDAESLAGLPADEAIAKFTSLIAKSGGEQLPDHQFILKPVSGVGKVVVNPHLDSQTPKIDLNLSFDTIGVCVDDAQYRDAISMVDMFHFYIRYNQYRKYRDPVAEQSSRSRALLRYAGRAILAEVHDKNRRWSWSYFAERRDERRNYVELFKKQTVSQLSADEATELAALERKLVYEDIRFYRSIARSQVSKDKAARRQLEERRRREQPKSSGDGGWLAWAWGSSSTQTQSEDATFDTMTAQQRQELYDAIEYDEKAAIAESFNTARDAMKLRVRAELNRGTFELRSDPHGRNAEVVSIIFESFRAGFVQRPENFEVKLSLGGLAVFDGTTRDTPYHQIVRVKDEHSRAMSMASEVEGDEKYANRFFFAKFEKNPLDERADTALTVKMRYMEIIYHKEFVEAMYNFLNPPESQLESVEALLDAASNTLEGFRRETRAGLEYALQTHKTLDVKLDMNAPIIIIPEDIKTTKCRHLLVDAGHISVESDLADKSAIKSLQRKRNQVFTDEDLHKLEALMYDKFFLKLKSAQFVIGNDMDSSLAALRDESPQAQNLHLLERINIDLSLHKSIVPGALNLARFRVSGRLPTLKANLSDVKYKALMRFIDVAIPKLGSDTPASTVAPVRAEGETTGPTFRLPPVFSTGPEEYTVADEDEQQDGAEGEEFFEASEGPLANIHQHTFEFNFKVDRLEAAIAKMARDGREKALGDLVLQQFELNFALAKFDMRVDVRLRSLSVDTFRANGQTMTLLTSRDAQANQERDLLIVTYKRVQPESPEFLTVFEGVNQSVDVALSTFVVHAEPEPVITLYNFIMSTFVPGNDGSTSSRPSAAPRQDSEVSAAIVLPEPRPAQQPASSSDKLSVHVKLDSFLVFLVNTSAQFATLSLSAADVTVLINGPTMRVAARLENISLTDDSQIDRDPVNAQLLSIEGKEVAHVIYETFDVSKQPANNSINSSITFHAGALKFRFVEKPLHDIYAFLIKLARLKGLYDAATQAAVQRASELEVQRMKFDVHVQSPIVIFPWNVRAPRDVLTVKLGEISASNHFEMTENRFKATLRGIQMTSTLYYNDQPSTLKVVDDVEIVADIIQPQAINRAVDMELPDTRISVQLSDIKLALTQTQYQLLLALLQSIPRVFILDAAEASVSSSPTTPSPTPSPPPSQDVSQMATHPSTDLQPELVPSADAEQRPWPTLDLEVTIGAVKLHLYDANATDTASLKNCGIARFALNNNAVRIKMLSDGSMEAEVVLKSFTMGNTFPGPSRFREIIPAAQHERNQFMILYTASGGPDSSALAIVTVDSPQIIFAVDPIFALMNFFQSTGESTSTISATEQNVVEQAQPQQPPPAPTRSLDFRVDLHDVSIIILESDSDSDAQAIHLSIQQILMSQQGVLALTIDKLGMSLTRMGHPSERVSFLDDLDLTLTIDGRNVSEQQLTSIELDIKPIVLRASYRDINLIMTIVNKAIALSTSDSAGKSKSPSPASNRSAASKKITAPSSKRALASARFSGGDAPQLLMTKEQLKATFDGFRLILIGDVHEMPILHLKTKPFVMTAKDWSAELHATTTILTAIEYWNITNSHWEPLIEPWSFAVLVSKDIATDALSVSWTAKDRLDVNVSSTAVELGLATASAMTAAGDRVLKKARGGDAPYKIRNRTGCPLRIWTDSEGAAAQEPGEALRLADGDSCDWRFDDWKTMREHVSTVGRHNTISILLDGKPWEALTAVPVDREGKFTYALRPKIDPQPTRLLCEITVEDNVKVVTFRSTYKIENKTLYPIELSVDIDSRPYMVQKLAPGQEYALPIDAVMHNVRLRPDPGFAYVFSQPIRWENLVKNPTQTISCVHESVARGSNVSPKHQEPPFHFHAWAQFDVNDPAARKYPKMTLKLHAPIELENLLPYDLEYLIFDKHSNQSWGSFLRKGGIMPVHSVQLSHLVLMNVKVQDAGFKPSDFAIINTDSPSDFEIEKRLILQDAQGRKLDVRINYMRHHNAGGAFRAQIYSQYVVINKTGMPFAIRAGRAATGGREVAGVSSPESANNNTKPILLSHPYDKGHEFSFRVGNSAWSKFINFEAPGAEVGVSIPSSANRAAEFNLGLSWTEGVGKYKLSKVITLSPRFILKNMLDEVICFREHGMAPEEQNSLQPGQRRPLMTFRPEQERLLTFAYPGLNAKWCAPINVENIGSVHMRMTSPGNQDNEHLLRADVLVEGATIFIVLHRETDRWPFTIENHSQYSIKLAQTDEDRQLTLADWQKQRLAHTYVLPPKAALDYAWDFPASPDKKITLFINGRVREVDILEIGNLPPFEFPLPPDARGDRRRAAVSIDVRAEGKRQILTISPYRAETSLYKPRRSAVGTLSRQDTLSSVEGFEAVTQDALPTFIFKLDFDGLGVSLVNKRLVEVVYLTLQGIHIEYSMSSTSQGISFHCQTIQLDNQLQEALYPVVLQPTPLSRNNSPIGAPPTIQVSLIVLNDHDHGVTFVKYASILLQALSIQLDEDFLFAVYDLTKLKGASWEQEQESVLIQNAGDIQEPSGPSKDGQELYFEVLELQPIQLAISFMRTERVNADEKLATDNPLAVILNALTMAAGNINDAALRMNALAIKDMRLTVPELQTRIIYHYRQEVLRQLYRVLFSADLIGNPVGLFTNVSSGVKDVFYEPFHGVVHGNTDLGAGIAKGAASFVKKTVFGLSDTVTKVTGSIGKGISAATLDAEYQNQRRLNQRRNKPRHAIYGVTAGAEAFATSVRSGAEGLVLKPIEGAESGGAFGFFKGVGQGLVGAVTKPVVGVFDLASNVAEGIRNTTTVFDRPNRDRVRYARLVPADGVLVPYSPREALGQSWLRDLEHGRYKRESYVAHIELPEGDSVVLLTTSRILSFWSRRLKLEWDMPFSSVTAVNIEDTGILFKDKEGSYRDRFVHIPKPSSKEWFFNQISRVVRQYNARRRVDK